MHKKNRIGIRAKLMMLLGVLVAILSIAGFAVYFSLNSLFQLTEIQAKDLKTLKALDEIEVAFLDLNLFGMDVIVDAYSDPAGLKQRYKEFDSLQQELSNNEARWQAVLDESALSQLGRQLFSYLDKMTDSINTLKTSLQKGIDISTKTDEFDESIDSTKTTAVAIILEKKEFIQLDIAAKGRQIEQIFNNLYIAVVFCFGICFVVLGFWGIPMGYRLSKSIELLQKDLETITDGVERTSVNLSASSQTLAESATEASAAIQESVSSMTEMSGMLTQTSRNSTETAHLTREVLEQAREGVTVMNEMASSMDAISESSSRLKEIVRIIENIATKTNVINDVVFKTQLLAVNASIEAARAGHHGKGFAVVANEVASLAALSGNASAEIRDLLSSSSSYVNEIIEGTASAIKEGEKASERSSESFSVISRSVSMISEKIEQISTATTEQETGVSQTYTALTQMNQSTSTTSGLAQKNATLGKTVSSLAENLWAVNLELKGLVSGSKLVEKELEEKASMHHNEATENSSHTDSKSNNQSKPLDFSTSDGASFSHHEAQSSAHPSHDRRSA